MGIESDIRKTRDLYDEMRSILGLPPASSERIVARVSAWSPIQQIAHVSKANSSILSSILDIVEQRRRFDEGGTMRPIGRLILRTGVIPRGIGKAPTESLPDDNLASERLESELDLQIRDLNVIDARLEQTKAARQSFSHPYFGDLTPRQWVRFIHVHTHHHVKIVREILSAGDL